jgi:hypothetical protein
MIIRVIARFLFTLSVLMVYQFYVSLYDCQSAPLVVGDRERVGTAMNDQTTHIERYLGCTNGI